MSGSRFGSSNSSFGGTSRTVSGSRGYSGHIGAGHTLNTSSSFGHSGSFGSSNRGLSGSSSFHSSTTGMRSTTNGGAFHGNSFHNTTFSGSHNGSWSGSGWHGNTWHGGWNNGWHGGGWRGGWHGGWGCCGWGWGFGWGWVLGGGWGWGGWWGPWWWGSSYAWGYPAYAYPYPIYPNYGVTYPQPYSGTDQDNSYNNDSSYNGNSSNAAPSEDYFQRPSFGGSLDAQVPQGSPNTNPDTGNVATTTPTVLIYLKDGTMYTASDYWLVDGKLHYLTSYSTESVVSLDEVDLQRTVDENAKRGVTFNLKPNRNGPAAPESTPAPRPEGRGTASSDPNSRDGGATPAANPSPDPIPAPQTQEAGEMQT
jgi:hypothetical protein